MHANAQIKVSRILDWLCESHLDTHGGYPYDFEEYKGRVFIAMLDDAKERNRTLIVTYTLRELEMWYNRAEKYLKKNKEPKPEWNHPHTGYFGDWEEAFNETRPEDASDRTEDES